ncbi:calcium-binding protein [Pseudaestuariivita atlantica]|uniref:Peptidase M10 serralysin C-terminal domain-containing protein n=1 Tax=Pseudaestuariivita atlantica TaxID=1317121 RepID=A0A0L1JNN0_9RHOB|nr:hypothetical protein [Pseudaestuariivita atlantica]KNG93327.1 hypothetical protein ATO11_12860 [Pseudaestuariivita atlantica]
MAHLGQSFTSFEVFLNRADVDAVYRVDLAAFNSSGVTGDAIIAVNTEADGTRYLNVMVVAENTAPGQVHPMHIHGVFDENGAPADSRTPTLFNDTDRDGMVEVLEGLPSYGDVILPFSDNGAPIMSDANGQIVFIQNYDLGDSSNFFSPVSGNDYTAADLLPLELRELVLHGLDVPEGIGDGTEGEVNGMQNGYVPILPAAAGEIEEITVAQALDILDDARGVASDSFTLTDGADTFDAGAGDDTVDGAGGDDLLMGGTDDDMILGGDGNDSIQGGAGADMIDGGAGSDWAMFADGTGVMVDLGNTVMGSGEAAGDMYVNVENVMGTNRADAIWGDMGANMIVGGTHSDRLYGRAGDDTLDGGIGNDAIYGNQGADVLTGGAGTDRFIFFGTADSMAGMGDTITDFTMDERIELSRIDGDPTQGGNQALNFVGDAAFSNTAGELRYEISSGNTVVQADVDGDGAADFEVTLTGEIMLDATNFLL